MSNWSEEVIVITKVKNTVPWTYVISDLKGEEIVATFYGKKLKEKTINYMLNGKVMIIHLIVRLITKKYCYIKMSYFPIYSHSKDKIEVRLDLSNYAAKSDLKNVTGVDTSQSAEKDDFANLKTEMDKLDIDKLAELDADKLKTVPINFKKLSDVADKKSYLKKYV